MFPLVKSEAALYAEIEKLSAAWEILDKQAKSKVFDLAGMEERLTKAGIEVSCWHETRVSLLIYFLCYCRKPRLTTSSTPLYAPKRL